jgi:CRP/FNR family cyclic AMP-dependent transcriptional regulator
VALRKNAKVDAIKHVPLFSQCSKRELNEVASIADELDIAEGKELTRLGGPGREFFVLLEGQADVRKGDRKISTLGKGDFFGEIALLTGKPRTATVVTRSPARVLVITERNFKGLLEHSPGIQLKILRALADRISHD